MGDYNVVHRTGSVIAVKFNGAISPRGLEGVAFNQDVTANAGAVRAYEDQEIELLAAIEKRRLGRISPPEGSTNQASVPCALPLEYCIALRGVGCVD